MTIEKEKEIAWLEKRLLSATFQLKDCKELVLEAQISYLHKLLEEYRAVREGENE